MNPAHKSWDAFLDPTGRWLLTSLDYREWGFFVLIVLVVFSVWRRGRYGGWPSRDDHFRLLLSLTGATVGLTVMVVFLFTNPPAIELLSGATRVVLGLGVLIFIIFGESVPQLKALFFPTKAPKPPIEQVPKKVVVASSTPADEPPQ